MKSMIQKFWNNYLAERGSRAELKGTICFGENRDIADALANAAACGKKTVMTYPENGYRTAMKGMPQIGDLNIAVNWAGEPVCVLETVKVSRIRFCEADEGLCAAENGDPESWKQEKEAECKRELEELGAEFDENISLIVEEFRCVFLA